jgi:hypothetical protein
MAITVPVVLLVPVFVSVAFGVCRQAGTCPSFTLFGGNLIARISKAFARRQVLDAVAIRPTARVWDRGTLCGALTYVPCARCGVARYACPTAFHLPTGRHRLRCHSWSLRIVVRYCPSSGGRCRGLLSVRTPDHFLRVAPNDRARQRRRIRLAIWKIWPNCRDNRADCHLAATLQDVSRNAQESSRCLDSQGWERRLIGAICERREVSA